MDRIFHIIDIDTIAEGKKDLELADARPNV